MWQMGPGWGWWMLFGWIWIIALVALVVWAVSALTERGRPDRGTMPKEPSAQEILERRYASGELTDEQFEAMRRRLREPDRPT